MLGPRSAAWLFCTVAQLLTGCWWRSHPCPVCPGCPRTTRPACPSASCPACPSFQCPTAVCPLQAGGPAGGGPAPEPAPFSPRAAVEESVPSAPGPPPAPEAPAASPAPEARDQAEATEEAPPAPPGAPRGSSLAELALLGANQLLIAFQTVRLLVVNSCRSAWTFCPRRPRARAAMTDVGPAWDALARAWALCASEQRRHQRRIWGRLEGPPTGPQVDLMMLSSAPEHDAYEDNYSRNGPDILAARFGSTRRDRCGLDPANAMAAGGRWRRRRRPPSRRCWSRSPRRRSSPGRLPRGERPRCRAVARW